MSCAYERREPCTRAFKEANFDETAGSRDQNLKAAIGQVVGKVPTTECNHCGDGDGPFITCHTAWRARGLRCMNCDWMSGATPCSLREWKPPDKLIYSILTVEF